MKNLFNYYSSIFSINFIINLNKFNKNFSNNREFAIRKEENNAIIRYLNIKSSEDFLEKINKFKPSRIEIGPIYNVDIKLINFQIIESYGKEIIIDLDITDYNDVINCKCPLKALLCNECLLVLKYNILITNNILINYFRTNRFFWLFSGKKGFHCVIYDEFFFLKDNNERKKLLNIFENYRTLKKAIIQEPIESILLEKYIQDEVNKYFDILKSRNQLKLKKSKLQNISYNEKLFYLLPKIDVNVFIGLNHLSKIAYSIHPSSNLISSILDHRNLDSFNIKNDILILDNLTVSKFIKSKQFKYLKYTVFCKNNFYCLKCFKIGIKELKENIQITNENYNNFILSIKLRNLNDLKLHLYNNHKEFDCDILYENKCSISYLMDSININYSSELFINFYKKKK